MVYIFNKYISPRRPISNASASIYGIGRKSALAACNILCINPKNRFSELTLVHASRVQKCLTRDSKRFGKVGSLLRKEINENIKRYIKIRSYRGLRHKNKLPVRGQRTHTNAQTQRRLGVNKY